MVRLSILYYALFFAVCSRASADIITIVDEFERADSAKMASRGVEAAGGLVSQAEGVRLYPTGKGELKGFWDDNFVSTPTNQDPFFPYFCEADGGKTQCPPPSEGFQSDAEPYPTTYHARFSGSGNTCTAGVPQFYFDDPAACFARWLRLKSVAELDISTVNSFSQLSNLRIVWIPGTSTNGGDRPDVHTFLPNYVRARENLHVIAVDANENIVCNVTLWDIHDYNGTIAPPWTDPPPSPYLREYTPEKVFTVSDIELPTTCLQAADSFLIWQRRKTDVGDNYGVKRIEMSFDIPNSLTVWSLAVWWFAMGAFAFVILLSIVVALSFAPKGRINRYSQI